MTINRLVKLLLVAAFFLGLWMIIPNQAKQDAPHQYLGYVNEVQDTFAKQMQSELNLICTGNSGKMHKKSKS